MELLSLAVVFELGGQDGFDVLRISRHNYPLAYAAFDRVAAIARVLLERVQPEFIDLVIDGGFDDIVGKVELQGGPRPSNRRPCPKLAELRIIEEPGDDCVANVEDEKAAEQLRRRDGGSVYL